jgi:hypothetical protein
MTAPPARDDLFPPAGTVAPATAKSLFGTFYDYVTGLLGADGTSAKAREALNIALPNYLDNPNGSVYQRNIASTADGAYFADRWYALSQTANVTPSQQSDPEDGYRHARRITQPQVTAQRIGSGQVVPGMKAAELRGKTVTAGGRVKSSAGGTIRCALLAWTGSEDSVTRDVVSDWATTTFTTGNFFAATSLSLIATGSVAASAGVPTDLSCSGAVPSNAKNLIYVEWTDATQAQNATLDSWGSRIVQASALVDFLRVKDGEELRECQRYYESGTFFHNQASGISPYATVQMKVTKRAAPTVSVTANTTVSGAASTTALSGTIPVTANEFAVATGSSGAPLGASWTASADL